MNKLTALANKYNCDKGTIAYEAHEYTEVYYEIIPSKGKFSLLEIGVWHGDSIKMWNEFNPELKIDGIDIDNNIFNYIRESENISLFIGNQTDEKFLSIVSQDKQYDFIIDDGSHKYEDIIASFKYLYTKLKPGGYYIIEDLHAQQAQGEHVYNFVNFFLLDSKERYTAILECNNKLLIVHKWLFQ